MATQRVEQLLEKEEVQNQKIFNLKAQQGYTFEEVSTITGGNKNCCKKPLLLHGEKDEKGAE
ncbi:MAG: hypothetical protein ACLU70_09665 [Lachnospira sp.]